MNRNKFAVLTKAKQSEIHEGELPALGENQVLIQQQSCNICTTDYGQWLGLREHQPYPMAGGHEVSGIVVEKGINVGDDLQVGDLVAVTYNFCGECEKCHKGLTSECINVKDSANKDGYYGSLGFAKYCVRDKKTLVKMNKDLHPSEAAFLEPLATVVKGLKKIRLAPMETVVIIGAGTMGLVNAQAAKAFGARVIVTELMDKKINVAQSMGLEVINGNNEDPVKKVLELTNGEGADVVILAVGATTANDQAIKMVKYLNGRILLFAAGYPAPELNLDSNTIHYRKMEVVGTYGANMQDFIDSGKLLNQRMVDVSKLIETSFPLEQIQNAYEAASTLGNYRVSVILN